MNKHIHLLHWILSSQFGIDPENGLRSIAGIPRFLRDKRRFRENYKGTMTLRPCLQDWNGEGGSVRNEYFWQDLLVARWIHDAQPQRHVDVGSRIDGFVAHVASFRDIEIFDVRPLEVNIPGVTFRQADLMHTPGLPEGYCDSLSCLHALEHFGLGRYGDPIDPGGYEKGLANMARMLSQGGVFYLSVPIGKPRVEFNAHRVFDPMDILRIAALASLSLQFLTTVQADGIVGEYSPETVPFGQLASIDYMLGIFRFTKN